MFTFLAAGGFDPLAFDPSAYVLTVLTFLILIGLLGKFTWKPMLKAIEARESRIEDAIQQAEDDRKTANELLATYESQVANVEQELAALREKGRADAEAIARDVRAQADADAKARVERAVNEIALAHTQAIEDIRQESVLLGMAVATKVVGRSLDGEDQLRLANEVVSGLSGMASSGI
jgi:F-type H+-transporting ATPase subunit b